MAANGLGPWWFPAFLREFLTNVSKWFFNEAAWEKHDEGYELGYPCRADCDKKFLQAMLRDASKSEKINKILTCTALAIIYWSLVRLFGWASYNKRSTTHE